MTIPADWVSTRPLGQSRELWAPRGVALNRGHIRKTIEPSGGQSWSETDVFRSGRMVRHPDPDAGVVPEEVSLIIMVKDNKVIERKGFGTMEGWIDYEAAKRRAEDWSKTAKE